MPITEEIQKINDIILNSVECERIYLFGSYAYGTPTANSDYDFYVVLKDDSPVKALDVMEKIDLNLIRFDTPMPIDVLANYKKRFDYMSTQPSMERKIASEGVVLYERH
jgi:predicted nucleotidyltransferase